MVKSPLFDVFLAHNSKDKPQVRSIAEALRKRGLNPWLDEEQIPPGRLFQDEIQKAIPQIKAAAICIGLTGLGKWQALELSSLINQFIDKECPIIPILLPGVDTIPDNLHFLKQFNWVNFKEIDDQVAFYYLEWGITGNKPNNISEAASSSAQSNQIELKSEKGVDYTKLRDLLKAGKWKDADEETANVMLQAANRTSKGYLEAEDIDNFPCEDLRTINQLWLHYSKGKFGFSVQAEIYRSLGGTREYNREVWKKFGDRVGWRKGGEWLDYDQLTFELLDTTPVAHLPIVRVSNLMWGGLSVGGVGFSSLASRLVTCNISPSQTFVNS